MIKSDNNAKLMTIVQRRNDPHNFAVAQINNPELRLDVMKTVKAARTNIIVSTIIKAIYALIGVIVFYIITKSVRSGIKKREQEEYQAKLYEKEKCKSDYEANFCDHNINDPKYQDACREFQICKDKEIVIEKSEIAFQYFGRMIDEFFNALSFATILKIIFIIVAGIYINHYLIEHYVR